MARDSVIAIERVGSTAVPGLAAKPIIDVAVGVASLDLGSDAFERMARFRYAYGGTHDLSQHVFRRGAREILVHPSSSATVACGATSCASAITRERIPATCGATET